VWAQLLDDTLALIQQRRAATGQGDDDSQLLKICLKKKLKFRSSSSQNPEFTVQGEAYSCLSHK
jgi:hypothetical protein